jgi:hypothetical protein
MAYRYTAAVIAIALAVPSAGQGRGWTGTYVYQEALGRDAVGQGNAVSVTHRLTIAPGACRLRARGYQTDTTIRCRAVAVGADRLQVVFVSNGDGRVVNQYGVAQYRPGQPLLLLERHGGRMTTLWQGYTTEGARGLGVYLRRV